MAYLLFASQIAVIGLIVLLAIRSDNKFRSRLRQKGREREEILALSGRVVAVSGPVGAAAGEAVIRGLSTLLGESGAPWAVGEDKAADLVEDRPGALSFATRSSDGLRAAEEALRTRDVVPICELVETLYAIRNGLRDKDVDKDLETSIRRLGALMERDLGAQVSTFQPGDQVDVDRCEVVSRQGTNHTIRFVHGLYCSTDVVTVRAKIST